MEMKPVFALPKTVINVNLVKILCVCERSWSPLHTHTHTHTHTHIILLDNVAQYDDNEEDSVVMKMIRNDDLILNILSHIFLEISN